jgi:hypothetical protein
MYRTIPLLRNAADEVKLWRYLDLSEFLWLLTARALYFSRLNQFDDKWEGKLTAGLIERIEKGGEIQQIMEDEKESEEFALLLLKKSVKAAHLIYGINCWHSNDVESVAMWKLYTQGKDGVAIQKTVSRLKTCLSHERRNFFIEEVDYVDHETLTPDEPTPIRFIRPLVTKRRSFRHETEVRVILERMRGNERDEFFGLLRTEFGETVSVDLPTLLQKIVVAPDYPIWAIESLQEQVTAAGLSLQIEKSDLLRLPDSDEQPFGPEARL